MKFKNQIIKAKTNSVFQMDNIKKINYEKITNGYVNRPGVY